VNLFDFYSERPIGKLTVFFSHFRSSDSVFYKWTLPLPSRGSILTVSNTCGQHPFYGCSTTDLYRILQITLNIDVTPIPSRSTVLSIHNKEESHRHYDHTVYPSTRNNFSLSSHRHSYTSLSFNLTLSFRTNSYKSTPSPLSLSYFLTLEHNKLTPTPYLSCYLL
jgi:hypothetical protein